MADLVSDAKQRTAEEVTTVEMAIIPDADVGNNNGRFPSSGRDKSKLTGTRLCMA